MKNSFIKANLTSLNSLRVLVFTSIPQREKPLFKLRHFNEIIPITASRTVSQGNLTIYEFSFETPFIFGEPYKISLKDIGITEVDVSDAVNFPEFDNLFNYDGDDLGATYSKKETSFALWAPLAESVALFIAPNGCDIEHAKSYFMKRTSKGVFRITLKGDYLNYDYVYAITNSGATRISHDPYGKGTNLNSVASSVVDTSFIKNKTKIKPTREIKNYVDAVIYETSVRDFTEGEGTNIINKGKYLGLTEENKTTSKGFPAGLDYLKFLGISHLQLLPVIDFRGVDDKNVNASYNWGYDPISIFSLEGSYAVDPINPMSRLIEFRQLVDTLHKNNIRVIMDIVFNHQYDYLESSFEKALPDYFFRRKKNGQLSEASGCGNDFASERYMAKKAIIDALKYFVDVFDVDGFRFDLMGLIDKITISDAFEKCKQIKDDIMFYGEGWDMGYELPSDMKSSINNASSLPSIAFFNDSYRDIIKGPNSQGELERKGYINGDISYVDGAEFVICGSILKLTYDPKFISANQSINYVECHDNFTLFDKLSSSNREENISLRLNRIELANALVALSIGIPFYHMGQEIGLSKKMNGNTYNVVGLNKMDWHLVDERFAMVKYLKDILYFRKHNDVFKIHLKEDVISHLDFYRDGEKLYIKYINNKEGGFGKTIVVLINPSLKSQEYVLDKDSLALFSQSGLNTNKELFIHRGIIGPGNLLIFNID